MSILWLRWLPADLGRAWRIIRAFLAVGVAVAARRLRVRVLIAAVTRVSPGRARRIAVPEADLPRRVRETFEALGPTFVKLGQILSVRPDIVPPEYVAEFSRLQAQAAPVPLEEVKRILTAELGQPPEAVFRAFRSEPLGSASLAQVHFAILPSLDRVAVKVQRPDVRPCIRQDIRLLRWLARWTDRHIPGARAYRPVALIEEFADWTTRELDFRVEALNADHFRYNFSDDPTVYVPKVHWDLTTARVLTMEYVDGATVDDVEKMERLGIDAAALARNGVRSLLKQVFVYGFFHGDPHPGNFFALPGNRICYHDFGIVGHLTGDLKRELTSYFVAFSRGDVEAAVSHLTHATTPLPGADADRFCRGLTDLIGAWHYTGRQSLASTFLGCLQAGARYGMAFPSALALWGKALLTIETVAYRIYPEFDIDREFRPFIAEVFRYWLSPERTLEKVLTNMLDYAHAADAAPQRFSQVLDTLARGQVSLRIDQSELDALRSTLHLAGVMRVLAPLVIVLVLASAIAFRAEGITQVGGLSVGLIWFFSALALGAWLLYLLLKR